VKQTLFGDHMMDGCGNGDTDRLDAVNDLCKMKEGLGLDPLGDFFGTVGFAIDHPNEFHAF
jgi:hypothetical protein